MELVLDLPLPPRALHPNARTFWAAKARHTKQARDEARLVALIGKKHRQPWSAATVRCQFTFRDKRSRDKDNLLGWLKAYFDGIADAGVVANDSGLTHLPVEIMPPNQRAGVRIIIAEAS